jgi:hypothetical protein
VAELVDGVATLCGVALLADGEASEAEEVGVVYRRWGMVRSEGTEAVTVVADRYAALICYVLYLINLSSSSPPSSQLAFV